MMVGSPSPIRKANRTACVMWLWLLFSLAAAPADAQPAPSHSHPSAGQLIEEITSSGNYQLEFPDGAAKPTRGENSQEGRNSERSGRKEAPPGTSPSLPGASGSGDGTANLGFLRYLLWGAGVIVAAIFLFFLIAGALDYFARREPAGETGDRQPEAPIVENPPADAVPGAVEEADKFAADQDFTSGVRHLLLQAFEMMRQRFGNRLAPFLTNREVLAHLPLSGLEKRHLQVIVAAEELSQFGARRPTREIYDDCRANLSRLAQLMDQKEE